jgi:arylsulfatase A
VWFTSGYCSASTCTPTRYSFLTGTYAIRKKGTGIAEKTLVVFCSDNGPVLDDGYNDDAVQKLGDHEPAGPYRGGKYSVWEGGTRTPFITRWKGRIEPGVSDEVVCTVNLCASVGALTEPTLGEGACLDSMDVLDALLGKPGAKGRDHLVQQDNGSSGNFGFRVGDWKLVRFKKNENTKAVVSKPQDIPPPRPHTLYRLSADPGERKDVSAENPEVVEALTANLDKLIADGRSRPAK